jgi:hypothetical protein
VGLIRNIHVLATSTIGDDYRELRRVVDQLATELEEMRELQEARYRRLAKRQRDDQADGGTNGGPVRESDLVARIRARRAARGGAALG